MNNEQEGLRSRPERPESVQEKIFQWWRGDAHAHSTTSTREGFGYAEGVYDVEEMAAYYHGLGLEFLALTEHSSKPGAPERQAPDSLISRSFVDQARRITELNQRPERAQEFIILSGAEVNIFFAADGSPTLDLPDEVLEALDLVIASRHGIAHEKEPAKIKESLLMAVSHPLVDVIGHPDRYTRRDKETSTEYWEAYWAIWPEILDAMVERHVAFELNLNSPPALRLVEMAAQRGVKFFINFDAHDFTQYKSERTPLMEEGYAAIQRWAMGEMLPEDEQRLEAYKTERLKAGPGVRALLRLVRCIHRLERLGVTPDRVINSSPHRLLTFLCAERGKRTKNLQQLID